MTPLEIQAATPAMLTRKTWVRVLTIHMAGLMDDTTTDFTREGRRRWGTWVCLVLVVGVGFLLRGMS